MTEKEAIEIIEAYKDRLTSSCSNQLYKDICAFEMAIRGLRTLDNQQDIIKSSYDRGYADGTADEYHAIMDILNKCGVTVCMEDKQLLTIAEYVEMKERGEL